MERWVLHKSFQKFKLNKCQKSYWTYRKATYGPPVLFISCKTFALRVMTCKFPIGKYEHLLVRNWGNLNRRWCDRRPKRALMRKYGGKTMQQGVTKQKGYLSSFFLSQLLVRRPRHPIGWRWCQPGSLPPRPSPASCPSPPWRECPTRPTGRSSPPFSHGQTRRWAMTRPPR